MENNVASKYLDKPPLQWGLRGDPLLWEEMKAKMEHIPAPTTKGQLVKILYEQFKDLTGEDLIAGKRIFLKKYDKGGMSSGMVAADFWLEKAFPLIIQRFIEIETP